MSTYYAKITSPVCLLHGTKDMLVPYSNVDYAKKIFTKSAMFKITTFEAKTILLYAQGKRKLQS